MGIYIKDMEMPKSCGYCPMLDDYGDYPVCQLTKEQRGYNFPVAIKRMDSCPLIPVPPHGRLIDERALHAAAHDVVLGNGALHRCIDDTIICELPTVIPAEEGE